MFVTDDNPRGEDPAVIREEIMKGLEHEAPDRRMQAGYNVPGRREAIMRALDGAGAHDIILIAGKGHEQGQIIGSGDKMQVLAFDDVEVARECAAALAKGTRS